MVLKKQRINPMLLVNDSGLSPLPQYDSSDSLCELTTVAQPATKKQQLCPYEVEHTRGRAEQTLPHFEVADKSYGDKNRGTPANRSVKFHFNNRFLKVSLKKRDDNLPSLPTWENHHHDNSVASDSPTSQDCVLRLVAKKRSTLAAVLSLLSLMVTVLLVLASKSAVATLASQVSTVRSARGHLDYRLRVAEKDLRMMQREVDSLHTIGERLHEEVHSLQEAIDKAESAGWYKNAHESHTHEMGQKAATKMSRIQTLRAEIQSNSLREVVEKFGDGPTYNVQFDLVFPDSYETSFVVETAPIDQMPHSVQNFLDMVSNGLWDGTSFSMAAVHLVKASPLSNEGSFDKTPEFLQSGLEGPSFMEYSDKQPHKKYTLGFAGHNAPSWYINTEDNSDVHGPSDEHEPDPCFAKVVAGFEAIDRISSSPTRGGSVLLEKRVGIKRARILTR